MLRSVFPDAIYCYQPKWLAPAVNDIFIPSINAVFNLRASKMASRNEKKISEAKKHGMKYIECEKPYYSYFYLAQLLNTNGLSEYLACVDLSKAIDKSNGDLYFEIESGEGNYSSSNLPHSEWDGTYSIENGKYSVDSTNY